MQLSIYAKLEKNFQNLNKEQLEKLKKYLEYHCDSFISSNEIANKLNISLEESKKIINELIKADIVIMCFKVYCDKDQDTNKEIYTNIQAIPNEECQDCDKKCSILKNIIILYKVICKKD